MSGIWATLTLTTRDLELTCLPGIGGRLWDVAYKGRSILFQNPDLEGVTPDLAALRGLPTRSPQFRFPLWGGEKTWIAPDTDWGDQSPYPILDSGPYRVIFSDQESVHMRSPVCETSGLQIDRRIRLVASGGWTIQHQVRNSGTSARRTGIWSVLMLKHSGRIGLRPDGDAGVATVFGNAADRIRRSGRNIVFDCHSPQEFKCGVSNTSGSVVVGLGDPMDVIWLTCRTLCGSADQRFAHGHNFEIFNSGDYPYFEAEWHSPLRNLEPGETMDFEQHFVARSDLETDLAGAFSSPTEQELLRCMS